MRLKVLAHNKKIPGCSALKLGYEYEVVEHCGGYKVFLTPDKSRTLSIPKNQLSKVGELSKS